MESDEQVTEENSPIKILDMNFLPIIVALIVGILIAAIFLFIKKRALERKDFVLIGLCDSGKTVIYLQLVHSKFCTTFTSIAANVGDYECSNRVVRIIDIPGHDRVRDRFFDQYKCKAKGLIFVIDSVSVQKDVCELADCLYSILSDNTTLPCSVLIACNKQDEPMTKSAHVVKTLLEKEMNLIRKTRASKLQSVDENDKGKNVFLGKEGKDFNFAHITQNVEFLECSAKDNQLSNIVEWIKRTL